MCKCNNTATPSYYRCIVQTHTHTLTLTHNTHKHTISSGRQSARRLQVSAAFPPVSSTLARAVDRATPSHKPRLAPSNGLSHQGSSPDQSLSCHDVLYRGTSALPHCKHGTYLPNALTHLPPVKCSVNHWQLGVWTVHTVQYRFWPQCLVSFTQRRRHPTRTADERGAMTSTSEITKVALFVLAIGRCSCYIPPRGIST